MATHSAIGCHSNATESYLYVLNSLAGTSFARVADALHLEHNCACFKAGASRASRARSPIFPSSHTWSHVHLNQGTYEQIAYQLELIENAMIKILGVKPLYFRPPYGEYNEVVLQVLRDRGYRGLILWSQDSGDSLGAPPSSSEIIESYRSYPDQTNVLNHETKSFTVNDVMPNVIPILKDRGFNLQTVPACLNLGSNPSDWYVSVQQPGSRDETWTCNGTPSPGNFE
ncbi:hypothetical protein PGT21_004288 [Puccinia graminis f. sp. tritici]|uniref:NodB homology domain-containing protein n=1 Tax=Puccinia graminis f. sp. tritici TaxID=56615 RepID=A0A5B0LK65_PUCGR|nr:hypothetical protein PGT21_004288 [Puccinia graminis f. sp. tritici]